MNLMHLLAKKDPNLALVGDVTQVKARLDGRTYSGLSLGPRSEVRLANALRWYPFNTRPHTAGWLVQAGKSEAGPVLETSFEAPGAKSVALTRDIAGPTPGPAHIPLIHERLDRPRLDSLDLVMRNTSGSEERLLLWVTETLPTEPLYALARGVGAELGPGPYPRLASSDDRTVSYVERDPVETWREKYSFTGTVGSLDSAAGEDLWKQYTVGLAHDLPFEDHSLDFLFSADVLEHLVNPLGHLQYWRTKLRPGGQIIKVIPYLAGCGDYRNRPTKMEWWLAQFHNGGFEETVEHHRSYAVARDLDPDRLMARGLSSHFSFFERANLAEMLEFAVSELGYSSFNIHHGSNSKKIHFVLYN